MRSLSRADVEDNLGTCHNPSQRRNASHNNTIFSLRLQLDRQYCAAPLCHHDYKRVLSLKPL